MCSPNQFTTCFNRLISALGPFKISIGIQFITFLGLHCSPNNQDISENDFIFSFNCTKHFVPEATRKLSRIDYTNEAAKVLATDLSNGPSDWGMLALRTAHSDAIYNQFKYFYHI